MSKISVGAGAAAFLLSVYAHAAAQTTAPDRFTYAATTPAGSTISYNTPTDTYFVRLSYAEIPTCKDVTITLYIEDRKKDPSAIYENFAALTINTSNKLLRYADFQGGRPMKTIGQKFGITNVGTGMIWANYQDGRIINYTAHATTPVPPDGQRLRGINAVAYDPTLLQGLEADPNYQSAVHTLDQCEEGLMTRIPALGLKGKRDIVYSPRDPS